MILLRTKGGGVNFVQASYTLWIAPFLCNSVTWIGVNIVQINIYHLN